MTFFFHVAAGDLQGGCRNLALSIWLDILSTGEDRELQSNLLKLQQHPELQKVLVNELMSLSNGGSPQEWPFVGGPEEIKTRLATTKLRFDGLAGKRNAASRASRGSASKIEEVVD